MIGKLKLALLKPYYLLLFQYHLHRLKKVESRG
jgi:hypothetical protein